MNLLTPEQPASRPAIPSERTLRLVSGSPIALHRSPSKWLIGVGIVGAFLGGFGVSSYWRPVPGVAEPRIQVADFRVQLPEGDTTVVITSREGHAAELARLQIHRQGDEIDGLPKDMRRIEPRERLSPEDAAFLRSELNGVVSSTDSAWDKANKIRAWLGRQTRHLAMPGLATRHPREAYQQMKIGQPVLCG